jgi:hypothetical protein
LYLDLNRGDNTIRRLQAGVILVSCLNYNAASDENQVFYEKISAYYQEFAYFSRPFLLDFLPKR